MAWKDTYNQVGQRTQCNTDVHQMLINFAEVMTGLLDGGARQQHESLSPMVLDCIVDEGIGPAGLSTSS